MCEFLRSLVCLSTSRAGLGAWLNIECRTVVIAQHPEVVEERAKQHSARCFPPKPLSSLVNRSLVTPSHHDSPSTKYIKIIKASTKTMRFDNGNDICNHQCVPAGTHLCPIRSTIFHRPGERQTSKSIPFEKFA
ncbi:hypothetical protein JOM56_010082 [Amanita muscaria]